MCAKLRTLPKRRSQLAFGICNLSETNMRKTSDTTWKQAFSSLLPIKCAQFFGRYLVLGGKF